jgi:large subunit ribosomal protein L10
VKKEDKERVVAELTELLRTSPTLMIADYRGLTMPQIDALRGRLLEHGARFAVVKNTLTRRAAEAAGADALLALLEGPTAIAFLEAEGDPVAVAKALADSARETRVLAIRGGILEGRPVEAGALEELAKLPPADVLRSQVFGAVTAPLTNIVALFSAPLQDLYGLLDARIEQLREQGDTSEPESQPSGSEPQGGAEPAAAADVETPEPPSGSEPQSENETGETQTEQEDH